MSPDTCPKTAIIRAVHIACSLKIHRKFICKFMKQQSLALLNGATGWVFWFEVLLPNYTKCGFCSCTLGAIIRPLIS